jgi:malate dehydrogenase (oxaloacetate-decarboxylating)(NADP+)
MKPVFSQAKQAPRRIVFAEGEDDRVLRAIQVVVDEGIARPILIGDPREISRRLEALNLRVSPGSDFDVVYADNNGFFDDAFRALLARVPAPDGAQGGFGRVCPTRGRRRASLFGAMMVRMGDADGLICGTFGRHDVHRDYVEQVIGLAPGVRNLYAMSLLVLPEQTLFLADTYINYDPSAEQLVDMTLLAADEVRRFGVTPRVALLSHSSFGSENTPTALKMREALRLLRERAPELEAEGEMHGDAALDDHIRQRVFPSDARLKGQANLLIMPTLDAANISFNLLKIAAGDNSTIGPILLGRCATGAYPDLDGNRAADCQHDCPDRGRQADE